MLVSGVRGKKPIKEVEKLHARKAKLVLVSPTIAKPRKATEALAAVGAGQEGILWKMGIDILWDVLWGTHLCRFYQVV